MADGKKRSALYWHAMNRRKFILEGIDRTIEIWYNSPCWNDSLLEGWGKSLMAVNKIIAKGERDFFAL